MEKDKITQAGTRKAYSSRGERTQKMMSFRLDYENAEFLNTLPNKGRFINDLISQARISSKPITGGE